MYNYLSICMELNVFCVLVLVHRRSVPIAIYREIPLLCGRTLLWKSAIKNRNWMVSLVRGTPNELCTWFMSWWRHQKETFSALLALCAGNSSVTGEFPAQRPMTRSFDVFFHLRLNRRLSKQSWGWWFETPSWSLCRHCNALLWVLVVI